MEHGVAAAIRVQFEHPTAKIAVAAVICRPIQRSATPFDQRADRTSGILTALETVQHDIAAAIGVDLEYRPQVIGAARRCCPAQRPVNTSHQA